MPTGELRRTWWFCPGVAAAFVGAATSYLSWSIAAASASAVFVAAAAIRWADAARPPPASTNGSPVDARCLAGMTIWIAGPFVAVYASLCGPALGNVALGASISAAWITTAILALRRFDSRVGRVFGVTGSAWALVPSIVALRGWDWPALALAGSGVMALVQWAVVVGRRSESAGEPRAAAR